MTNQLQLNNCPHCGVNTPNLQMRTSFDTTKFDGSGRRIWTFYACARCGGVIMAVLNPNNDNIVKMYPESRVVSEAIPPRARGYLTEAIATKHSPSASIMVANSAIDAMFKAIGLSQGNLFGRINEAEKQHLITSGMAKWAHQVRLDANDQRHADEDAAIPSQEDADRIIEFALALGEFLFVLPSRVDRGIVESSPSHS